MASYTQNLDLQKLDGQDLFDEAVYNANLEKIDSAVHSVENALGDTKIIRTSRENYDDGTGHSSNTIYFVVESDGKVSMYLGDTAINSSGGGTSAGSVVLMTQGTVAAYGVATVPESEEV